jgi:hypothetical protein
MIVGILGLIISVLFLALGGRRRGGEVVDEVPVRRRERP